MKIRYLHYFNLGFQFRNWRKINYADSARKFRQAKCIVYFSTVPWQGSERMGNRAGDYRKNLSGEASYLSFVPQPLPPIPRVEMDDDMIGAVVAANKSLAMLEGVSSHIPDMSLFVSMYVRKEALMSSQIEGTQATLEDVLDPMLEANMNRNVADVINYIKATEYAVQRLRTLPGRRTAPRSGGRLRSSFPWAVRRRP